jgi:hypothetical protein
MISHAIWEDTPVSFQKLTRARFPPGKFKAIISPILICIVKLKYNLRSQIGRLWKLRIERTRLHEKYKENFDVSSEGPSSGC